MTIENIREAMAKTYEGWELQATTFRTYNVRHDFFDEMFSMMTFIGNLLVASGEFDADLYDGLCIEAKAAKEKANAIISCEVEA